MLTFLATVCFLFTYDDVFFYNKNKLLQNNNESKNDIIKPNTELKLKYKPSEINTISQLYCSITHAISSSILSLIYVLGYKDLYIILIANSCGYFSYDIIYTIRNDLNLLSTAYVIHHILSIFFILQDYSYINAVGLFLAESSNIINLITVFKEDHGITFKDLYYASNKYIRYITYFSCRCVGICILYYSQKDVFDSMHYSLKISCICLYVISFVWSFILLKNLFKT